MPGDGRVGLLEGTEQARLQGSVDADAGVADLAAQHDVGVGLGGDGCRDRDRAPRGELDRVADVVHEDLGQAQFVAVEGHPLQGFVDLEAELQALGEGLIAHQAAHLVDHRRHPEVELYQRHAVGLDAGDLEHVVDDLEQMQRGRLDGLQLLDEPGVAGGRPAPAALRPSGRPSSASSPASRRV
ncbi:MAG: hypothetical protein KGN16_02630 [Burkholderiales bacterium]|nr:hypothetical protein [Burkholderiales bacterium]